MFKVVFYFFSLVVSVSIDVSTNRSQAATCDFIAPPIPQHAKITILAEGDSITFGNAATDGLGSYVSRSTLSSDADVRLLNNSKSGAILGVPTDGPSDNSLYARFASDNVLLRARQSGEVYIITILIGRNDLVNYGNVADYLTNLGRYVDALRKAGWDRVVVGTLLPSNWPPFKPLRTDWNAAVLSNCWASKHHVAAIVPFGEMPEMGSDAAAASTAFYADGTHPNNKGYEAMAVVFAKTINGLREGDGRPPHDAGQP